MSFDSNKNDLLKQISQNKRSHDMERRNAEAKNRLYEAQKQKETGATTLARPAADPEKTQKPPVVIFAQKSIFVTTLKDALQQYCEIHEFAELDKATDFLFSMQVPLAFMDMCPPNDYRQAQEFFSTGKTMNPSMRYIVYHKEDKLPEYIEALIKQGATVFKKPIDRLDLIERVKNFTALWREQNAGAAGGESESQEDEDEENTIIS